MAVKMVPVCDVDGKDGGVESYRIVYPDGETWEVDLCEGKDAALLEQFRDKGWGGPAKRGKRRGFEVTPLEEIQSKSRKPRKRP